MMIFLTLLLAVAVLALFVQNSNGAYSERRRAIESKKRSSGGIADRHTGSVRSRGNSGASRNPASSSKSADVLAALVAEDDEEDSNQRVGQASFNANVDHVSHVVSLESSNKDNGKKSSIRLELEGGAWKGVKPDGTIEYMMFESIYTYRSVVKAENGELECSRFIYDVRHKNKNPSILYGGYYADIPRASLIYIKGKDNFIQEFVFDDYEVSWTREESTPSDFTCYYASLMIADEGIGQLDEEFHLTWMGPSIGLYAEVEMEQYSSGSLTVISELDGHNKTVVSGILPQNSNYRYVVASFNNVFWAVCRCDDKLMQSTSATPIDVGFEVRGAAAMSETILFLCDVDRIVKYDLLNKEILATFLIKNRFDIAISLDKMYVYYVTYDGSSTSSTMIVALNANDLSYYRSYSYDAKEGEQPFGLSSIEVTPTHMWVGVDYFDESQTYLAKVTLHDQ